jgi:hypothetical protein
MPFCFNAPYRFTPLPNLHPCIFIVTPSGWFIGYLFNSFLPEYFLFMPPFFEHT